MRADYLPWQRVKQLFEVARALNLRFGVTFNAHATLSYGALRVSDPAAMIRLHRDFNLAARRWVQRKIEGYTRDDAVFAWAYVHENARDHGVHTHQILCLPWLVRRSFNSWAQDWLKDRYGRNYSREGLVVRLNNSRSESAQVEAQWRWFRYVVKSAEDAIVYDKDGPGMILDLLMVPERWRGPSRPVPFAQRCGWSHNLGQAVRDRIVREWLGEATTIEGVMEGGDLQTRQLQLAWAEAERNLQRLGI